MNRLLISFSLFLKITLLLAQDNFSFVFLPDIHIQPDSGVIESFHRLTGQINRLHPDFVLTGGDMIYTAKNVDDIKASQLFDLMDKEFMGFKMPVYLTIGNHEHVGITADSGIDKTNPMWGKRMFESRYGNRYYTFTKGGWKFFIIDGIKILEPEKNYTQGIDSLQINWIREELDRTDEKMPLIISVHTPLVDPHLVLSSSEGPVSGDSEKVLDLFKNHNLRIVLEGHNHVFMNLYVEGINYISGGSAAYGTDLMHLGFVMMKIKNQNLRLQFIRAGQKRKKLIIHDSLIHINLVESKERTG